MMSQNQSPKTDYNGAYSGSRGNTSEKFCGQPSESGQIPNNSKEDSSDLKNALNVLGLFILVCLVCIAPTIVFLNRTVSGANESTRKTREIEQHVSNGEDVFLLDHRPLQTNLITQEYLGPLENRGLGSKEIGATYFDQENWNEAIKYFRKATQQDPLDPESLIYLNNSIARRNGDFFSIAAVVPIVTAPNRAKEWLRGIAHAQTLVNSRLSQTQYPLLEVFIVNYPNSDYEHLRESFNGNDVETLREAIRERINIIDKQKNIFGVISFGFNEMLEEINRQIGQEKSIPILSTQNILCLQRKPDEQISLFVNVKKPCSGEILSQSGDDEIVDYGEFVLRNVYQMFDDLKNKTDKTELAVLFDKRSSYSQMIKTYINGMDEYSGLKNEYEVDSVLPPIQTSNYEIGIGLNDEAIKELARENDIIVLALDSHNFPDAIKVLKVLKAEYDLDRYNLKLYEPGEILPSDGEGLIALVKAKKYGFYSVHVFDRIGDDVIKIEDGSLKFSEEVTEELEKLLENPSIDDVDKQTKAKLIREIEDSSGHISKDKRVIIAGDELYGPDFLTEGEGTVERAVFFIPWVNPLVEHKLQLGDQINEVSSNAFCGLSDDTFASNSCEFWNKHLVNWRTRQAYTLSNIFVKLIENNLRQNESEQNYNEALRERRARRNTISESAESSILSRHEVHRQVLLNRLVQGIDISEEEAESLFPSKPSLIRVCRGTSGPKTDRQRSSYQFVPIKDFESACPMLTTESQ